MKNNNSTKGITILEILIVVAVGVFLITITFSSFFSLNKREVLKGETFQVLSAISRARSLTLSSKNDSQYGVHIDPTQVVIFSGSTYDSSNGSNEIIVLNSAVNVLSTVLNGGGNNIIFNRLSGTTSQYGTTTISLVASSTQLKSIVVYPSGIAEIQ